MPNTEHKGGQTASTKDANFCTGRKVDVEKLWEAIRVEARAMAENEPVLRHLAEDVVLSRSGLAASLAARLARRLAREDMTRDRLEPLLLESFGGNPEIVQSVARDLTAIAERDPACSSALEPLLFFKGFLAIATYRASHQLWLDGRKWLALYLQSLCSEVFAVDIHPAARIGCGIMLDHATSFVVGETAIIENDVSIMHEVTLGGTGKEHGDRHPIIRSGVLLGAGAKIIGRVEIGQGAKVGAGSVVLMDVPPHVTVVGVPAVVVGESEEDSPAMEMNQRIECRGKR